MGGRANSMLTVNDIHIFASSVSFMSSYANAQAKSTFSDIAVKNHIRT